MRRERNSQATGCRGLVPRVHVRDGDVATDLHGQVERSSDRGRGPDDLKAGLGQLFAMSVATTASSSTTRTQPSLSVTGWHP